MQRLPASPGGRTLSGVSPEVRRVLNALVRQTGDRLDRVEQRLAAIERAAFDFEERIAGLEQQPPRPLGGVELQRQRAEAVLAAEAEATYVADNFGAAAAV